MKTKPQLENEIEQRIYNLLEKSPKTSSQISRNLKLKIEEVGASLTILEMQGIIEKLPGGAFQIK